MVDASPSAPKGTLARLVTLALTLAISGAALGAVWGGYLFIAAQSDSNGSAPSPMTTVAVTGVEFTPGYTVKRSFTGQVEAAARADLGFELGGRITHVMVEEGDRVTAGTVLAKLDTSALLPERAALEADLSMLDAEADLARLTLARNSALTERGLGAQAALDEAHLVLARAEAGKAATRARIAGVNVQLDKSVLVAPFDARIGSRLADPGQTTAAGQTVLVLFDAAPARVRVGLPPGLAAGLSVGDALTMDVGGVIHPATILKIRPDLDPSTRSRSIVLTLPSDSAAVLGETVALALPQHIQETGFWAPVSALREGVRGSWSVMAVESTLEGDRTRLIAVEVIHSESARVFLRGSLPEGQMIVAEAPDRVAPGQKVLAMVAANRRE